MMCECSDHGCPVHPGKDCDKSATVVLRRIDFAGTPTVTMCESCADDAMESGVFSIDDNLTWKLSKGFYV